jgi:hypothetical protein
MTAGFIAGLSGAVVWPIAAHDSRAIAYGDILSRTRGCVAASARRFLRSTR